MLRRKFMVLLFTLGVLLGKDKTDTVQCYCCGQQVKLVAGHMEEHQQTDEAKGTIYETNTGECYASGLVPHARCHCGKFIPISHFGNLVIHGPSVVSLDGKGRVFCNPERKLRSDVAIKLPESRISREGAAKC